MSLTPTGSSLLLPTILRRNEDIYISTYLILNCNQSLSTITQWTVHQCAANCSLPISMGQDIVTTASELFIPAGTLSLGTYQLNLTASMAAASHLSSSACVYITIVPSPITVNLVPFGTSMIAHGYQQDLLLDPGSFSLDPDTTTFNRSVSISVFVWKSPCSIVIY